MVLGRTFRFLFWEGRWDVCRTFLRKNGGEEKHKLKPEFLELDKKDCFAVRARAPLPASRTPWRLFCRRRCAGTLALREVAAMLRLPRIQTAERRIPPPGRNSRQVQGSWWKHRSGSQTSYKMSSNPHLGAAVDDRAGASVTTDIRTSFTEVWLAPGTL